MFNFCSLNITDIQNHPLDQFERRLDSQVNDYSLVWAQVKVFLICFFDTE